MNRTLILCLGAAFVSSLATYMVMKEEPKTEGRFHTAQALSPSPARLAPQLVRSSYNPAYGILGFTAPTTAIMPEFACTYMPPYTTPMLNPKKWHRAEVILRNGKPETIDFIPVSEPTPEELARCETREDFEKLASKIPFTGFRKLIVPPTY